MALGDIIQATLVQELDNQTLLSSLYYRDLGTNGTLADFIDQFNTVVVTAFAAFQSEQLTYERIDAQIISPPPRLVAVTLPLEQAGGVTGTAAPTEVAAVISKRTALAGRRFRGRLYVGGVPTSSIAASQLTDPALASLGTLASLISEDLEFGGVEAWAPILWGAQGTKPPVFSATPLTTALPNRILRSQRRRQIGVGI